MPRGSSPVGPPFSQDEELDYLVNSLRWSTSTSRSSRWLVPRWEHRRASLPQPPSSTLEEMADPVSLPVVSPKRYFNTPMVWQTHGTSWEHTQKRPPTGDKASNTRIDPQVFGSTFRHARTTPGYSGHMPADSEAGARPFTGGARTLPPAPSSLKPALVGYSGHIPRGSGNLEHAARYRDLSAQPTTHAATFRTLPAIDRNNPHARRAPLSTTVTTVYPHTHHNLKGCKGTADVRPQTQRGSLS